MRRVWVLPGLMVIAALSGPVLAASQMPPLPMPRPDPNAAPATIPRPAPPLAAHGTDLSQQRLPSEPAPSETLGTTPEPVTLSAEIEDKGKAIPKGLVWRIFDPVPDKNGQLPLIVKSDHARPTFNLKPGEYVVHVAYGLAQATDSVHVGNAGTEKSIVLNAGAIRLNAAITGDIPIPAKLLHFDIFATGTTNADRTLVDGDVKPGDMVTLNAGTYHVVSYFGKLNAVVRADLRVEPGQLTDATLYQNAAQVSFKLVTQAGGEAIADIDWTVKTSDGKTIYTDTGTFPTAALAKGDYLVLAKRGTKVYNRQFEVKAGKPENIEVLTSVY